MGGKSDKQFIETVYRILRDEFQYVPKLSRDKFFNNGFTEQKLILTSTAYQYILDRCRSSKKQKPKQSNKENANPNKIEHTKIGAPSLPCPEITKALPCVEVDTHPAALDYIEHTPIRQPPKPDNSQTYNASLYVDESIIDLGDVTHDDVITDSHPILMYSVEGAREVFAKGHLMAASDNNTALDIDSTPKTVISDVQYVHLSKNDRNPETLVVKEAQRVEDVYIDSSESVNTSCYEPCNHAEEISEIKKLLETINARLDILESKSNHATAQRLKSLSEVQKLTAPSAVLQSERGILKTVREVSFNLTPQERVLGESDVSQTDSNPSTDNSSQSADSTDNSSQSADSTDNSSQSADSSGGGEKDEEEEGDIKNFLKSVSDRLNNTRSFLRTYETT